MTTPEQTTSVEDNQPILKMEDMTDDEIDAYLESLKQPQEPKEENTD